MKRRPSQRKQPNLRASWLVLGNATPAVLHHGQRAYLQPVQGAHHPSRYKPGQRLSLKTYIPGPTEGHVILTSVDGITERFRLGHVTDAIARELGHANAEDFRLLWVEANDDDWIQRAKPENAPLRTDAYLERFEKRWAPKLAWLLRFRLDHAADPHLLAARSDELYVSNPAMALPDEMPALRPDEWEQHVGPQSRYREFERLRAQKAEREAGTLHDRLQAAQQVAKAKGYDVRDEVKVCEAHLRRRMTDKAKRQIELIEARVFPIAA